MFPQVCLCITADGTSAITISGSNYLHFPQINSWQKTLNLILFLTEFSTGILMNFTVIASQQSEFIHSSLKNNYFCTLIHMHLMFNFYISVLDVQEPENNQTIF